MELLCNPPSLNASFTSFVPGNFFLSVSSKLRAGFVYFFIKKKTHLFEHGLIDLIFHNNTHFIALCGYF